MRRSNIGRPRKPWNELSRDAIWKRLQREKPKPDRCSECFKIGPVDWHHTDDYSEGAPVVALCRSCHNGERKGLSYRRAAA